MRRIVVVGGYGRVGSAAAEALAPSAPGRVVVAGRDPDRAADCAARIGHGVEPMRFDLEDPGAALDGAALVLMCAEPREEEIARRCLANGIHYVDVTADADRLAAVERLDGVAREGDAAAVLSVGLAPGATNLLAAHIVAGIPPRATRVETLALLGLADAHGPAAVEWTLAALAAPGAFAAHTRFRLPGRSRPVRAFSFPFPEERTLPRTLGVREASSWLALEPSAVGTLSAAVIRLGGRAALRHPSVRRRLAALIAAVPAGSAACAVAARAGGRQASLTGRGEARITGLIAAEVARHLLDSAPPPGVHHLEQLVEPARFLATVAATDPALRLDLPPASG